MKKVNLILGGIISAGIIAPITVFGEEVSVKSGDTLYSIAKTHNLTVDRLKQLNNLTTNTLYIGQKLVVSEKRTGTIVNCDALNIRTGAGFSYPVKTTIKVGTEVTILSNSGEWRQVQVNGVVGYVAAHYVQETTNNISYSTTETLTKTSGLFKSPGVSKVSSLAPQRVTVLARGNDGWLQVKTWLGPLWVKNGVVTETVVAQPTTVHITQTSGLFKSPGVGKVSSLAPQRVTVLEKNSDGWMLVQTWLGKLWVKNGVTTEQATVQYVYLTATSGLFKAPASGKVSSLSPQRVVLVQKGTDGWNQVKTWLGPLWVKNGVTEEIKYTYITETSGLFKTPGEDRVSLLSPQRVILLEEGTDGWKKVQTWLGPLWVKNGFLEEDHVHTEPTPEPAAGTSIEYTVVSGDTLSSIAAKHQTTYQRIMLVNNLSSSSIYVGQKLNIEIGAPVSLKIFDMPVEGPVQMTSGFGPRWGTQHYGVDFSRWGDVKILAAADGEVTRSLSHATYGEVIYIKHTIDGKNYETLYAHMRTDSRAVQPGDKVTAGQFIGWMGSTGRSTGQHLHFEVHLEKYVYGSSQVDPLLYLK